MTPRARMVALVALLIVAVVAVACGAAAPARQDSPAAQPTAAPAAAESGRAVAVATMQVERPPQAPAPPEEEKSAAGTSGAAVSGGGGLQQPVSPNAGTRKIIKDGEMQLVVDELTRAIDRITKIAVDPGGYVLSAETNTEGPMKIATVKIGVPSDDFEDVMRQLRGIALEVRWERSSGKDVTEEYVDLQSQLINLEATQARLREFLDQAKTVEEALKVNAELTKIEGEIEQVKGRMTYLRDRAAYSTLTIYLEQIAPTPTVTPTPSITPTPSPTLTPTPIVWKPGETFQTARTTLTYTLRGIGDIAVWAGVLCVPLALIAALVLTPLWLLRRRIRRGRRPAVAPAVAAPAPVTAPPPAPPAEPEKKE